MTLNLISFSLISIGSMFPDEGLLKAQSSYQDVSDPHFAPFIHKGEMVNYASVPVTLETVSADSEKKVDKPVIGQENAKIQDKQASVATATNGPVKLQMKPWIGEEQTSQTEFESTVVMPTGWVLAIKIKGESTNICIGVDDAGVMKIITVTRLNDPEQTMENIPPDQAKALEEAMKQSREFYPTKTVSISRMRPDGTVINNSLSRMMVAVTGTLLSTEVNSDLFGIGNLQLSMFPDKPINVGESWTQQTGTNNNNINTKSTLLGFDEIQGQKCAKIQIEMLMKIQYGDITSSSTSSSTEYFSTEDGLIVKIVGVSDTIPNQQEQGTTKNSFTTELVKRKKLTPDELKVIQAEADELEIAFGYMQKDNDSANKALQQFVDTHPQSRLKEGVEGIITYMNNMKKMREKMQNK